MALLRPCGRIVQAFGKSLMSSQLKYIRGIVCTARVQDYVTVTPEFDRSSTNIEKINISSNNVPDNDNKMNRMVYSELVQLCRYTNNGEIRQQDLLRLMENPENADKATTVDSIGLALLRSCDNIIPNVNASERRNLTNHIWDLITEKLSKPTLQHYHALLRAYARNFHIVDAKKFLDNMRVKPDALTHQLLLNCTAKNGDVESSLYILSLMKKNDYSLTKGVFDSLVEVHAISSNMKSALAILEEMREAGIEPGVETFANIARGYARIVDIPNMMKILNTHALSVAHILEIAITLSLSGHGEHLAKVLKFLSLDVDLGDPMILEKVTELTNAGNLEDAYAIVDHVTSADFTNEKSAFINNYLKNLVRAKIPSEAILEIMNHIATKKKHPLAIMDVCEGALICGERELSMALFELMRERSIIVRPHYYWPLFLQASRNEGEADICRTIKHMLCLDVRLDHETLVNYVFPYVNTIDPLVTIRKFGDLGLNTSITLTPLICHLLMHGNLEDSLSLLSRVNGRIDFSKVIEPLSVAFRIKPNIDYCARMFKYAAHNKTYAEEFIEIINDRVTSKKDAWIVEKFLHAFSNLGINVRMKRETREFLEKTEDHGTNTRLHDTMANRKLSVKLPPHPSEMSINELECHLIELRSKGMNTRGVIRRLLMLHCPLNNITRVAELTKEYNDRGFLWTSGMYSHLLLFYIRNNRTKEAHDLFGELREHHNNFKIDDVKIVQLAKALIDANQIDDAIPILESTRSKGGVLLLKQCWRLLNAVVNSSKPDMTEKFLDILVNAGYCKRVNSILGPLVRQHLLKNNLPRAVETFERIAKHDRCTPLRQELVHALLKNANTNDMKTRENTMKLLDVVQRITTEIHSANEGSPIQRDIQCRPIDVKQDVFWRLQPNLDRFQETKKNVRISEQVFTQYLEFSTEHNGLEIFTEILDYCENLSNIQKTCLNEQIILLHSRSGDYQSAIEHWRKMTKDIRVSRKFRMNFVSLLEKHNVPLPEDFHDS